MTFRNDYISHKGFGWPSEEFRKVETGSSEGVCLAWLNDVDAVGDREGGAVGAKHSALLVLIPKVLLLIWLPRKLAIKERRLCEACIIAVLAVIVLMMIW